MTWILQFVNAINSFTKRSLVEYEKASDFWMKNGKKIKPFPVIITFQANNFPVDWLNGVSRDDCTQCEIIISKQRYCGTIQRAQNVDICVGAAKPFLQIEIQKGLRTINWEEKSSNRLFNNFISPSHLVIQLYLRLRGCSEDFPDITWTIKRKTAGVINLIATDVYQENRYLCKGNKSWFEFKWNLLEGKEKWFGVSAIKYLLTRIPLKQRTSSQKGAIN